jgi:pimeloyl-ACP methyl ester carboxylesterase
MVTKMPIRPHGLARAAVSGAAVLAAAGVASAAFQEAAAARDRRRFPPPGRLIDIGGRRLHILDAGQGAPAVVVVPALADGVVTWIAVQRALAPELRMVLYDRSGVGWSDPPRGRRTPDGFAAELRELLSAAQVEPPYLLVAHSLGGIIARRFAARWPGSVAGLILVDSSHEAQATRAVDGWPNRRRDYVRNALRWRLRPLGAYRIGAGAGLARELAADTRLAALPEHAGAYRAIMLSTRLRRTVAGELLMMGRLTGPPPQLGSIPLTVITAGGQELPGWREMQAELAALSSSSRHIIAEGSGHYVHLDQPQVICDAIRTHWKQARSG